MNGQDENWNDELEEEVSVEGVESLVVYSRDWTVDTILRQIEQGNIDLNPGFQRRNAWNDVKRSKLIESLIIGVPVPEIVLAEDLTRKKSFIVIDGKQRLLALAGFSEPENYPSWDRPRLKKLNTRSDLNGLSFSELVEKRDDARQLMNADIRCTVISNYKSPAVLYDIFYRLNTGSVPLGSQELRQVLNRGPFADYLISATNELLPVHGVLRLKGPDNRLRDAEIVLRYIAFSKFGPEYGGNLTPFLDECMARINKDWQNQRAEVHKLFEEMMSATEALNDKFGTPHVGRKFSDGKWEVRFNRALFEAFCANNAEFLDSIETSTKNLQRYRRRYELFQEFVNETFGAKIDSVPLPNA